MFDLDQYQLLDFGRGEKLESFAGRTVRRETPAVAKHLPRDKDANWNAELAFRSASAAKRQTNKTTSKWIGPVVDRWKITHREKTLLLRQTPTGQVGVFPEQVTNWEWIDGLPFDLRGLNAINLFAYTGGTTLALAARGAEVTHVDSASSVVKWARSNAAASGLEDHPIRWIVEDALKFMDREIKRGRRYDILIADPPSYGTGPKQETWKLSRQIDEFLTKLAALASPKWNAILLTSHTPGFDGRGLGQLLRSHFRSGSADWESFEMSLAARNGKALPSGSGVRVVR